MQAKLSTIWIFVMFNMIYADILSFLDGEFLAGLLEGNIDGIPYSVMLTVIGTIVVQIPILMVLLSRFLKYRLNRMLNIGIPILTMVFVVGGGSLKPHYVMFAGLEIIGLLAIIFLAWRWQDQ